MVAAVFVVSFIRFRGVAKCSKSYSWKLFRVGSHCTRVSQRAVDNLGGGRKWPF